MAVRPEDALICPACQTRNRARWEFCVRCGESLQDVTLSPAPSREAVEPPDPEGVEEDAAEQQDTGEAGMVLLVGVLVLIVLNAVACLYVRDKPPPARPSPDLFTLGTQPAALPAPAKEVEDKPGARDFEEGRRLLAGGDAANAIPFLSRAIGADPDNAAAHDVLGQALAATGALEVYAKVLALAPAADIARGHLAQLLYEQGKPENAIALVQEGIQRDPQTPSLRRRLGSLLEQSGRPQEAAREYREYSRLAPNAPDAKDFAERAAR